MEMERVHRELKVLKRRRDVEEQEERRRRRVDLRRLVWTRKRQR